MKGSGKRVDLRFGAFACSVQGFDDPLTPLSAVLKQVSKTLGRSPALAEGAVMFEPDTLARLEREIADAMTNGGMTAMPGLVLTRSEDEATKAGSEDNPASGLAALGDAAARLDDETAENVRAAALVLGGADAAEADIGEANERVPGVNDDAEADDGGITQLYPSVEESETARADEPSILRRDPAPDTDPDEPLRAARPTGDIDLGTEPIELEGEGDGKAADAEDEAGVDADEGGETETDDGTDAAADLATADHDGAEDTPERPIEIDALSARLRALTEPEDRGIATEGKAAAPAEEPANIFDADDEETRDAGPNIFAEEDEDGGGDGGLILEENLRLEPEPEAVDAGSAEPEVEAAGDSGPDDAVAEGDDPAPDADVNLFDGDADDADHSQNLFAGEEDEPSDADNVTRMRFRDLDSYHRDSPEPEEPDEDEDFSVPPDLSAHELVKAAGARTVPDLICASAAWIALVRGHQSFTRSEVMEVFEELKGDHPKTLEAKIKGFGKLVRNGQLTNSEGNRFRLSEDERDRFERLV